MTVRLLLAAAAAGAALGAASAANAEAAPDCHAGVYRLADARLLDLGRRSDGQFVWRLLDGRTGSLHAQGDGSWVSHLGWSNRSDGVNVVFGECGEGRLTFEGQAAQRVTLIVRETKFSAGDVMLAGRLILPPGHAAVPISVMVHGSEKSSALAFNFHQRMWPAAGIGVFVYDKRGTGASEGKYTQDFHRLAQDAMAAVAEARRLGGARASRLGLDGSSQGGWVAPLAASQTPVDFVIVRYGLADSPLAEDRDEVLDHLRASGHGDDVLAKARQVTDATGRVMASRYKEGWAELEEVKRLYGAERWFKDLEGEYTGTFVRTPPALLRIGGPMRDQGTTWDYDPLPVLRKLDTPLLWILASEDREAPVAETRERLLRLAADGEPVKVLEFPKTDHGMVTFESHVDGSRTRLGYAEGYLAAVLDWSRNGRLSPPYGNAKLLVAPPSNR